jgi:hypothetical protein
VPPKPNQDNAHPDEIELKGGDKLIRSEDRWYFQRQSGHTRFLDEFERGLVDAAIEATIAKSQKPDLEPGDKVFVVSESKLATVLAVHPMSESNEIRVDLCGNIGVEEVERYDAKRHAQYDNTFVPIRAEWKEKYGITKDVPLREESPRRHARP